MNTTRSTAARLGTAAAVAGLLLAAPVTAWAAPVPLGPSTPSLPVAVHQTPPAGQAAGNDDEAREYASLSGSRLRAYAAYVVRQDAWAAAAARLPSLPADNSGTGTRVIDQHGGTGGTGGWTVALAAIAGLLAGAGLTGAAARIVRPARRLRHA